MIQNGKEMKPGKNCRIYSMGRKRFCQIMQCSLADSGTYTCDAGEVNTSCSLEVYGKTVTTKLAHKYISFLQIFMISGLVCVVSFLT